MRKLVIGSKLTLLKSSAKIETSDLSAVVKYKCWSEREAKKEKERFTKLIQDKWIEQNNRDATNRKKGKKTEQKYIYISKEAHWSSCKQNNKNQSEIEKETVTKKNKRWTDFEQTARYGTEDSEQR